jgi:uncharacterized membrane protein YccC
MPIGCVNYCRYYNGDTATKQRTFQSFFGFNCRWFIAFGILFLVHDSTIIGGLAIIVTFLDSHLLQLIMKLEPFITIYVIFIYGILTPNIENLIQYRVLDTLVGAFYPF